MKKILIIATREWKHFFQTPFAMVVLPIYLVLCGVYFNLALENYLALINPTDTTTKIHGITVNAYLLLPFFKDIFNVLLFFIPLITMRSFAEEKKLATYDLLISYPVKPWEILLGKYLGAVTIILMMLVWSLVYTLVPILRGQSYLPLILTTYLGYVCFIIFYVAVGVVASLATENQIVAAIITYLALLGAALVQWLAFISPAPWDKLFAHFLLIAHLDTFRSGVIFLGDIIAYFSLAIAFLMAGYLKIRRHYSP